MSYGIIYKIQFKNREQIDCEVQLLQKDASDDITYLTGAENPFILTSQAQDNQIPYGIKATEASTQFYSQADVSLNTFYNEDDTFWRLDFYYAGVKKWTGYLQLDNCSEQITDTDHIITLNANDGLGRLQTQYLLGDDGKPLNQQMTLLLLLARTVPLIGLVLEGKVWLNVFENSTDDRSDHDYLTLLPETAIPTSYFINSDGTGMSVYDILNEVLLALRCMFTQADGFWQIIRWGDVRLFADGTMPGTLYDSVWTSASAITFDGAIQVGPYSQGYAVHPINENQLQSILRPYKFSTETFNYEQPNYIIQANLQMEVGATPYATNTVGSLRYDDYDLATYFPNWIHRDGDTSYLEVVTDTSVTPENEVDRYIVVPSSDHDCKGIQFNPVSISAGDIVEFSAQVKTLNTGGGSGLIFWVRMHMIGDDGNFYTLARTGNDTFPTVSFIDWFGPYNTNVWDTVQIVSTIPVIQRYKPYTSLDDWLTIELYQGNSNIPIRPAPVNGMLLVQMMGTNWTDTSTVDTCFKSVAFGINNFINTTTKIIGQTHENSQTPEIRNNEQFSISLDDTPRNTIKGALFTDALTNFDATDINTGETTDIGNIYFTRTQAWHRQGVTEARRLGDLNTYNDLFIQRILRTIVSGDFFGLNAIHLLTLINISWLTDKNFIFGAATFNYMTCIWSASLYELFDTGEIDGDLDNTYLFTYLYDTQK